MMAEVDFSMPAPPAAPGRKPKTSIYTVMLLIALVSLLIGCLILWLEIKQLGGWGSV